MGPLAGDLRSLLENVVKSARGVAEAGARQALESLAIHRRSPHESMTDEERRLRRRLRAHGRQLGDTRTPDGSQSIDRLVREVAYEHWHHMLFARFLAENHLLIDPTSGVAITLQECEDLAREQNADPWALAASFAQEMLPRIFRTGDPALEINLPPEKRQALQRLLAELPEPVFTADDSLGWTYQFWQSAEKDAVNSRVRSGEKITGETLPAVTQLFTEPYVVRFLLHNTVGAWHAGKTLADSLRTEATSEQELRDAARLSAADCYAFEYLRFVREPAGGEDEDADTGPWRPAAGSFDSWPQTARELKILDPCCGSGHFLVEAFELVVRLRMQEEGLEAPDAARAVIGENLLGLELDARCTQIAAFNIALAAWKLVGAPIDLPPMQIACSGMGPRTSREEWLNLSEEVAAAGGMPVARDLFGGDDTLLSAAVRGGLETLYDLFDKAPELGSLIDPANVGGDDRQYRMDQVDFDTLAPLLDAILEREGTADDEIERAVAAKGMAEAARILIGPEGGYTLVATNVPYRTRGDHADWFKNWCDQHHGEAKHDLATIFVSRIMRWLTVGERGATLAAVTPQNWLFLTSYRKFRERLLRERTWEMVARLGSGAFETISGEVVNVALIVLSADTPADDAMMAGIDVSAPRGQRSIYAREKAALLRGISVLGNGAKSRAATPNRGDADEPTEEGFHPQGDGTPSNGNVHLIPQAEQLKNPDARVAFESVFSKQRLEHYSSSIEGLTTGDIERFVQKVWEGGFCNGWEPYIQNVDEIEFYGGRTDRILWEAGSGVLSKFPKAHNFPGEFMHGRPVLGQDGIRVTQMGKLPVTLYTGDVFGKNAATVVPHNPSHLPAIWAFCSSPEFVKAVRRIDQSLKVTNASLVKVPFDLARWQKVAQERYPDGLPEPYSDDPTQWIFHGHPARAEPGMELQVAVARLVGYRWPAELDRNMRLSEEARRLVEHSRELDGQGLADEDGIVCLSPVRGEASAADRLRRLLGAAYGADWSGAKERELLAAAAESGHGTGKVLRSLDDWLREAFFEEHCKLFHQRPFVWHVWDGLKHGFNALVNYHRLAGPDGVGRRTLESLTFTYLGDWIDRQREAQKRGKEGADTRLAAAQRLQAELQKILEGEPPYDLFVRWKPLHEQPIGWDPDIDDGVRINIRPFLMAEDMRYKGAGVLRRKPNVKWTKADRGKEPRSLRPREEFPWFWGCDPKSEPRHRADFGADTPEAVPAGDEFDGIRWNELHYSRAAKEAARKSASAEVGA